MSAKMLVIQALDERDLLVKEITEKFKLIDSLCNGIVKLVMSHCLFLLKRSR